MMRTLDFNCDLGEGGGQETELLPFLTSASIACGGHAGDASTMRSTAAACLAHGVALGAHPSWPDRAGFGRREQTRSAAEVYALVGEQITVLAGVVHPLGGRLRHVKPHGALYNQAARDEILAEAIARAVRDVDPGLVLFGLAGSRLLAAGRACGLRVAAEVFADRTYQRDGSLTPRSHPGAVIESADVAVAQVKRMLFEGIVCSVEGVEIPIQADTLCLHGDHPQAPAFARRLHAERSAAGIHFTEP